MRIVHTSDWHLGRTFFGADLLPAQRRFIDHLIDVVDAHEVGAVIVAGDVYDRGIPPQDAMELYDFAMTALLERGTQVIVSSGNHDSFMRLGIGRRQLEAAGLHVRARLSDITRPVVLDHGATVVYAIPYLEPGQVHQRFGVERSHTAVMKYATDLIREHQQAHHPQARTIVAAHAFVSGGTASDSERSVEIGGVGVAPASVFADFDYVALGHLHRPQVLTPSMQYAGSPLPYSFGEAKNAKRVVLLDTHTTASPAALGGTVLPGSSPEPAVTGTAAPNPTGGAAHGPVPGSGADPSASSHLVSQQALELPAFEQIATLRGTLAEVLAQAPDHQGTLLEAELTDEHRLPNALAALRSRFPRLIRFDWVNDAQAPASATVTATKGSAPSDEAVFRAFVTHTTQRAARTDEEARFAAALADVVREDA